MNIETWQHHFKKHKIKLCAKDVHEILAAHLAKEVGLDITDEKVSHHVVVVVSNTDGLPSALVEVTETIENSTTHETDSE
ncbi:MAG: hypothetical protein DI627_14340 [Acinetobacter sp.]|uniref:hypothetical protein n=1 Tax=Acinetobacter sp. TaxID=472 RepID=UPI000DAF5CAA|nr:hypothetical protein [Acinetobacter sp.]PZT84906.1 MAG: hypothetical protein DI627_14340 [Acinetobacter sp.]